MQPARELEPATAHDASRSGVREGGIVLYDGVCTLCNAWVKFALKHDHDARLHFAPLQGDTARPVLERHGLETNPLGTVVFVENLGTAREKVFLRSDAALRVFEELGPPWAVLSTFHGIPRFIRDAVYDAIATSRYRWFGREESCLIPRAEYSKRFLP